MNSSKVYIKSQKRPTSFKTYQKATVIKTVQYWPKNRLIDQWNRIDSPEIDSHNYSQLTFDKGAKVIQLSRDTLQQMVLEQVDIQMTEKNRIQTQILYSSQKLAQNGSQA